MLSDAAIFKGLYLRTVGEMRESAWRSLSLSLVDKQHAARIIPGKKQIHTFCLSLNRLFGNSAQGTKRQRIENLWENKAILLEHTDQRTQLSW